MKALTICQPFATLIATQKKFIENRCWATNYRGPLVIHAGLGKKYLSAKELDEYPLGYIIAVAELVACERITTIQAYGKSLEYSEYLLCGASRITWGMASEHVHLEGPWCWVLENVRKIDPIPCKGFQRLWNPSDDIMSKLMVPA